MGSRSQTATAKPLSLFDVVKKKQAQGKQSCYVLHIEITLSVHPSVNISHKRNSSLTNEPKQMKLLTFEKYGLRKCMKEDNPIPN